MLVDELKAEQLSALDLARQVLALNEVMADLKRLSDLKKQAINAYADARILALESNDNTARANVIRAAALRDRLTAEIATRKEQARILQTLLRAIPTH